MSIYLQTTPSLRKSRKNQSPKFLKLDKDKVRCASNMPNYNWNPRGVSTDHIPSKIHDAPADANATSRNTMMDKVNRGQITGKDAEEVVRKSKCLAPAYNKGAVQYISNNDAARDAGKKT
jgi:hypothetical protein